MSALATRKERLAPGKGASAMDMFVVFNESLNAMRSSSRSDVNMLP
jgi:hypothetical protein